MGRKAGRQTLTDKAIQLAAFLHAGQVKYNSRIPYLSHVLNVVRLVSLCTTEDEVTAAAALHDVVEKAGISPGFIKTQFGERIAGIVSGLTEPATGNWKKKKQHTLTYLSDQADEPELLIACADKADNLHSLLLLKAISNSAWPPKLKTKKEDLQWFHQGALEIFTSKDCFTHSDSSLVLTMYSDSFRELFGAEE